MLDLLFRGAQVLDGAGAPAQRADVGVRDGRIVAVGTVDEPARRTLECDGLVLTPGLIDMHTHSDVQLLMHPRPRLQGAPGRDARGDRPGRPRARAAPTTRRWRCCAPSSPAGTAPSPSSTTASAPSRSTSRASSGTTAVNVCYLLPHATLRLLTRGRRRPPGDARTSSTPCARSCARASPRAPSASRPASPTRRACTRATTSWSRSARELHRRRVLLPAPPQLRPARAQGLRRLDRDRAPGGRAAAPRARAPRLRLQPRPRARAARADRRGARRRRRHHARHLSVPAGATYLHALLPGLGARRRPRRDDRATARHGSARAAARRAGGDRLGRLPRGAGRLGLA